jgi:hypothetical protein
MPELIYCLTKDDAEAMALPSGQTYELARAPYMNRAQPSPYINWFLVERAARELRSDTQALARMLLAARAAGRTEEQDAAFNAADAARY